MLKILGCKKFQQASEDLLLSQFYELLLCVLTGHLHIVIFPRYARKSADFICLCSSDCLFVFFNNCNKVYGIQIIETDFIMFFFSLRD